MGQDNFRWGDGWCSSKSFDTKIQRKYTSAACSRTNILNVVRVTAPAYKMSLAATPTAPWLASMTAKKSV